MKYKIEAFSIVAKEIKEEKLTNDLKKMLPVYEPVEIPDAAVGITLNEEIVATIPLGTPPPIPGLEQSFMKKYSKAICRIRYLMPEQIKIAPK